jgi:hypothetical protein
VATSTLMPGRRPRMSLDQLPELAARQRIDAGGRLVEDQQVGVVDERAAEAELLFHAAGELAGRAVGKGARPVLRSSSAMRCAGGLAPSWPNRRPKKSRFSAPTGPVEVLAEALGHVGDARITDVAVAARRHVAAEHLDPTLLDLPRAGDQRRAASTCRPRPGRSGRS